MAEEKTKETKKYFEVGSVATQTTPVVKVIGEETMFDMIGILCEMANDIKQIKKNIVG